MVSTSTAPAVTDLKGHLLQATADSMKLIQLEKEITQQFNQGTTNTTSNNNSNSYEILV